MEFKPHIVIIAIIFGGLFSWLRYVSLKREVGRSTAKQMMPFELIGTVLLGLVFSVVFSLTGAAEKMVWLIVAMLIPVWALTKTSRFLQIRSVVEKVTLQQPDPAHKNVGWSSLLFLGVGILALVAYFDRDQSDPFRLAYSALALATAAINLIQSQKPAVLTETGYYSIDLNLRWADIEAYQWLGETNTHDLLVYQRKTRWRLPIKSITCVSIPAIHQPKVNEFLSRYVAPTATLAVILD